MKHHLGYSRIICSLLLFTLFCKCSTNSDSNFRTITRTELTNIDQFINDSVNDNPLDSLASISMIKNFFDVVDSVRRQEPELSTMSLFAAAEYELFTPAITDSLVIFDFAGLDRKYRNSALASVRLLINEYSIFKNHQKVIVRFLSYPDYKVLQGYEMN